MLPVAPHTEGAAMMCWRGLTASLVFLLATGPACLAQEVSQLRGEVFLAGKTSVDPPPDEPKNSHAYMTVSGAAALRMYRAMKAKEEANLCEEGKRMKRAGALTCSVSRDGRNATCDFSIDLINGKVDSGRPC
jgi:hypothetical protein